MTVEEFNQLNEIEKEEVVLDSGLFISDYHSEDVMYDVYKVETFFVQFSYKLNETNRLSILASGNLNQLNRVYF
jgi:hypothetical protein